MAEMAKPRTAVAEPKQVSWQCIWDILEVVLVEVVKCAYLCFYLSLLRVGYLKLLEMISHAYILMKKYIKDEPKMLHCLPLHHLGSISWSSWDIFGLCGILVIYFVSMDEAFDVIVVEMIMCLTAVFLDLQCLGIPRPKPNLQWYLVANLWLDLNYMR